MVEEAFLTPQPLYQTLEFHLRVPEEGDSVRKTPAIRN